MEISGKYACYYDLLYQEKDHKDDIKYIRKLLQTYGKQTKSILDLGCGTGTHARLLAQMGYSVSGIENNEEMLQLAKHYNSGMPKEMASRLKIYKGDIKTARLKEKYDAIIALFRGMSYQTSNQDLKQVLTTVKSHIQPRGIFIFDCWYGPAVLTKQPSLIIERKENQKYGLTRTAQQKIYPNKNTVDIHYEILLTNQQDGSLEKFNETRSMRYLFIPEIEQLLARFQFEILECGEWMTKREPDFDTWNVYFVVRSNSETH